MKVTLDKLNRLVIPKALRERFALGPGKELEVLVESDGIRLRPVVPAPVLAEEKGLLICTSEIPTSAWDLTAFIEAERQGRSRHLAGI
jgi:AbrB family looped-hinge helix DNA binding protein